MTKNFFRCQCFLKEFFSSKTILSIFPKLTIKPWIRFQIRPKSWIRIQFNVMDPQHLVKSCLVVKVSENVGYRYFYGNTEVAKHLFDRPSLFRTLLLDLTGLQESEDISQILGTCTYQYRYLLAYLVTLTWDWWSSSVKLLQGRKDLMDGFRGFQPHPRRQ